MTFNGYPLLICYHNIYHYCQNAISYLFSVSLLTFHKLGILHLPHPMVAACNSTDAPYLHSHWMCVYQMCSGHPTACYCYTAHHSSDSSGYSWWCPMVLQRNWAWHWPSQWWMSDHELSWTWQPLLPVLCCSFQQALLKWTLKFKGNNFDLQIQKIEIIQNEQYTILSYHIVYCIFDNTVILTTQ